MPTNYTKLLRESQKRYNPEPKLTPIQIVKIVAVASILGLLFIQVILTILWLI